MTRINTEQLYKLLSVAQVEVTFTKVDGSERVMNCTLQGKYVPNTNAVSEAYLNAVDPRVLAVWDLDEQDWRSFRVNSIKTIKVAGFEYLPVKSMLEEG